jgi:hypothetical protein
MAGRLTGANHRALLGPIGVGKSMLLKFFAIFSLSKLPNLRPLYVSYDDPNHLGLPYDLYKAVWGYPDPAMGAGVSLTRYFTGWREKKIFPVFLFDEFQNVYRNPDPSSLLTQIIGLMKFGTQCRI